MVTAYDWTYIILTGLSILLVPLLVMLIRITVRWTQSDARQAQIAEDLAQLIKDRKEDQDKLAERLAGMIQSERQIHTEILEQMRVDRDATDRRLRFIEEFWMRRGQGSPSAGP